MKTKFMFLLVALGIGLVSSPLWASSARRLSLADLVAGADRVVVAELTQSRSFWGPKGLRIFTAYSFVVARDLAGGGAQTLTVVQPGGTVGRLTQVTHGYPSFDGQERLTLFLRQAPGHMEIVGLSQGVFGRMLDGGQEIAYQKLEGLHFPGDHGRPLLMEQGAFESLVNALWLKKGPRVRP